MEFRFTTIWRVGGKQVVDGVSLWWHWLYVEPVAQNVRRCVINVFTSYFSLAVNNFSYWLGLALGLDERRAIREPEAVQVREGPGLKLISSRHSSGS